MTREEAREAIKEAYGNSEYTDEIIEALEQEPVLDKIKAEIEQLPTNYIEIQRPNSTVERKVVELGSVIRILDKYKAETEET